METPRLDQLEFWHDREIHLALPPGESEPPGLLQAARPHVREGGALFRTSGTEGAPKWVLLDKRAFLHSARAVNAHYGLDSGDHWLIALPQHHVGGFSIWARAALSGAAVSVFESPGWDPVGLHRQLHDRQITAVSLVPTQIHDLVQLDLKPPTSLRVALVGGGATPAAIHRKALDLGWPLCLTYGMTETASQVASQQMEHDRRGDPNALEILPHWQVESDADGRGRIRGSCLARGYLRPEDRGWKWEAIDAEAGFLTQDLLRVWSEGTRSFLTFLGRRQHLTKVKGEWVQLEQLDADLRSLSKVGDLPPSIVLALPDERREHRLIWVIEAADLPIGIEAWLESHQAMAPPHLHLDGAVAFTPFPRTELGKVMRSLIQDRLEASDR